MNDAALTSAQRDMARRWYGYGRWDAPFWFIGIEPGGDELDACVRMWNVLGRGELVDVAAHHEEHDKDWFSPQARKPQKTWEKLIWLLLAYKGELVTPTAVLAYQKQRLGRSNEETALLEISSLPAVNNNVPIPRGLFCKRRIVTLRKRLGDHNPQFVVFYSPKKQYHKAWNAIAGVELTRDVPKLVNKTACMMTYHPNGKWSKSYWADAGCKLREFRRQHGLESS